MKIFVKLRDGMGFDYSFKSPSWIFSLPAVEIKNGIVRVKDNIGTHSWRTIVFPLDVIQYIEELPE